MRQYIHEHVPATTRKRLVATTCDLCKKRIMEERYCVDEVVVEYKSGSSFPEGGTCELIKFDICSECFCDVLRPWLEAQGAIPTTTEIDS